ncbi:MAG TPA: hypothetical protein DDX39_12170 [Bacteroidales bacterium]|nr:MAG: hypothetical protein A2W98_11575 [Bacteroidetes bacterium GWF2_33_38]OFY68992.1 MAG: hypothetical protein A2265_06070 [Bacteroidetes bacterium RIFOXYA12_FULL_33_9]HBF89388.1 hypothetical protein [Bacteroidales bacterium]
MTKILKVNWNAADLKVLKTLTSPYKIQQFLDKTEYNSTHETRSPRYVMQLKRAHCMEGALFAAACLENIGFTPLILDLRAENDDDHVIAVFEVDGFWGAIAKSNFTTLRYREPVYRTLRELTMSYFDFYFNTLGDKSLREYSLPFSLTKFHKINWQTTENDLAEIGDKLDKIKHFPIVTKAQIKKLEIAGDYLLKSSLFGSNPDGLFVPKAK